MKRSLISQVLQCNANNPLLKGINLNKKKNISDMYMHFMVIYLLYWEIFYFNFFCLSIEENLIENLI